MNAHGSHSSSIARTLFAVAALLALGIAPLAAQAPAAAGIAGDGDAAVAYDQDPGLPAPDDSVAAVQPPQGSYGYFRVIEGSATDTPSGGNERAAAEVNQPVLAGDRITLPRGAQVEIVLADHNLLRLDGGTDVVLDRLAGSADSNDAETRLSLIQGNLQLVVVQDSLSQPPPRIDTANASAYVRYPGTYRIAANAVDWTSVVVRRGTADLATERGTIVVRADEEALAEGARDADASVRPAGAADALERWGRQLSDQATDQLAQLAAPLDLDGDLGYSASSLAEFGSWIDVEGTRYWRPRVDAGWRPYWHGRWVSTPSGLTWVGNEPWGWVPYHYGSWDYLPVQGWVWAPGRVYSPAWVYWYWGPSYTGWCPVGYYTSFYRHRSLGPGFRFGVYGWAGGDWGAFARWSFVPTGRFGQRDLDRWTIPGDALRDQARLAPMPQVPHVPQMPRGIITTDTRGITPGRWSHPRDVLAVLDKGPAGRGGRLPDVTPFVARDPHLPAAVVHAVATAGPVRGTAGTPPRPAPTQPRPAAPYPSNRPPSAVAGVPIPGPSVSAGRLGGGRLAGTPIDRGGLSAGRDVQTWRTDRQTIQVRPPEQPVAMPPARLAPRDDARPERPRIVIPPRLPGDERGGRLPAEAFRRQETPAPRIQERPALAPRQAPPTPAMSTARPPEARTPPPAARQAAPPAPVERAVRAADDKPHHG